MIKRVSTLSATLAVSSAIGLRAEQEQSTIEPLAGYSDVDFDMGGQVQPGNFVGNGHAQRSKQWLCGNAKDIHHDDADMFTPSTVNMKAGIQLLRGQPGQGSLNYLKALDKDNLTEAERTEPWFQMDFSELFCGEYISQYRNPRTNASDYAGVCLRDNTPGWRWKSVVQTDSDVKEMWIRFGNIEGNVHVPLKAEFGGYQKADGQERVDYNKSNWNYQWGSGSRGDLPANWCSKYMKQFLCHVAFPQYAGPRPESVATQAAWKRGDTKIASEVNDTDLLLVRPTCKDFCGSIMDNCNRYEAAYKFEPFSGRPEDVPWPFIQRGYTSTGLLQGRKLQPLNMPLDIYDDEHMQILDEPDEPLPIREIAESNSQWCDFWNRGLGLAQAGTGVGKGDDNEVEGLDGTKRFCTTWEAGSSVMPALALTFMTIAAAFLN